MGMNVGDGDIIVRRRDCQEVSVDQVQDEVVDEHRRVGISLCIVENLD